MQGQELGLMILMGPFQLGMFYESDSKVVYMLHLKTMKTIQWLWLWYNFSSFVCYSGARAYLCFVILCD